MAIVTIPNNWQPRSYQLPLWEYLENGGKRAVAVWHRRAGKDEVCLHFAAVSAMQKVGTYWHMLPEASQAKKAIWNAVNPHTGIRRIDEAFPLIIRENTNEQEMFIRFKNGSTWQVVGSDNYNSLVGAPPLGIVFSEWSLADPRSWSYLRPILAENGGWAFFIYTPRGNNHGYTTLKNAQAEGNWFYQVLTAEDTHIFSPEVLAQEKRELSREFGEVEGNSRFMQEYMCSFDAAVAGAYYGGEMEIAIKEDRITKLYYDIKLPVHTAWDIGVGDSTAIWFVQKIGNEIRLIDFYESSGHGLPHYKKVLQEKGYVYGEHYAPHDIEVREFGSGVSRLETAKSLGINFKVTPRLNIDDGIHAVRAILSRCIWDVAKCDIGIECLKNYRKEYDNKKKCYKDTPLHDWTSHAADAFRYLAIVIDKIRNENNSTPINYSNKGIV